MEKNILANSYYQENHSRSVETKNLLDLEDMVFSNLENILVSEDRQDLQESSKDFFEEIKLDIITINNLVIKFNSTNDLHEKKELIIAAWIVIDWRVRNTIKKTLKTVVKCKTNNQYFYHYCNINNKEFSVATKFNNYNFEYTITLQVYYDGNIYQIHEKELKNIIMKFSNCNSENFKRLRKTISKAFLDSEESTSN
jgi:hypothetical protein